MKLHVEQKRQRTEVLELSAEDINAALRLLVAHSDSDIGACALRLYDGSTLETASGDVKMWVELDEEVQAA